MRFTPLLLILFSSFSMGLTISFDHPVTYKHYANGSKQVAVDYIRDYNERKNSQDWIAVYKKGTSTEWENVINWAWIKDLPNSESTHTITDIFNGSRLTKPGEYEVRYFKDNSYTVDQSLSFTIKEVDSYLKEVYVPPYDYLFNGEVTKVTLRGFHKDIFLPAKKDWVGIYQAKDDNTWENVVQWAWANDLKDTNYNLKLNLEKFEEGVEYEARYFLNNSFTTYKKSRPFYVGGVPEHEEKRVTCTRIINNEDKPNGLSVCVTPDYRTEPSKTWVGVFQKDIEAKNYNSLIAWSYLDKENAYNIHVLEILKPELLIDGQEYQTVYFIKDSYKQEGKAHTFILDDFN